jgi:hypothetical protein
VAQGKDERERIPRLFALRTTEDSGEGVIRVYLEITEAGPTTREYRATRVAPADREGKALEAEILWANVV